MDRAKETRGILTETKLKGAVLFILYIPYSIHILVNSSDSFLDTCIYFDYKVRTPFISILTVVSSF